jgi:hypothetical protein
MPTLEVVATGFVPLPNLHSYYFLYATLPILSIGLVVGLVTFCSNFGKPNASSTKILLSVVAADLVFCATCITIIISLLLNQGYALGVTGCFLNYYFIITSAILTLGTAALERYFAVVRNSRWSNRMISTIVIGIWIYSLSYSLIPFIFNSRVAVRLEENGWGCLVKWYGRDWGSMTMTFIAVSCITFGLVTVMFSYASVYLSFVAAIKNQQRQKQEVARKEQRVFLMCIYLTLSYVFFGVQRCVTFYMNSSLVSLFPPFGLLLHM